MRVAHARDHDDWTARMNELREAQAATDERLNILIDTVDRIIRHDKDSQ
jgi:pyruvate kinase